METRDGKKEENNEEKMVGNVNRSMHAYGNTDRVRQRGGFRNYGIRGSGNIRVDSSLCLFRRGAE